jgi:hypothetical protein
MRLGLINAAVATLMLGACGGGGTSDAEQNATLNAEASAANSIAPIEGVSTNGAGMSESAAANMAMPDAAANNMAMSNGTTGDVVKGTSDPAGGNMQ